MTFKWSTRDTWPYLYHRYKLMNCIQFKQRKYAKFQLQTDVHLNVTSYTVNLFLLWNEHKLSHTKWWAYLCS